ncbi:MAG: prolyl-tRNA synthetase, partial [Candidatus Wildermuthbacteria bacterium]|nr:prolyl-tRNA synthetase [Candidatus Wildermuthbacteria bacterium]
MRASNLFTKTRREAPQGEESVNAQLLIRAGFISKEMAGVYNFLPLGLLVLNKIVGIIREEMNAIGGQEVLLSSLQDPALWKKSGRWDDKVVDIWFKTKLSTGSDVGLANTHEEPLANLMRMHIASWRDLPRYVYQFQTKFRNELRARSGLIRTREFIMKDLYSFNKTEKEFREFYEQCVVSYLKIFDKVGLGKQTYRTFASGGSFSRFSDEFQTVCASGEDTIYINKKKNIAVNKEVYTNEVLKELGMKKSELEEARAVEVGNIFPLGTKYSSALGLTFKAENGTDTPVIMGSYGIGPARIMGTVVELFHDAKGILWPKAVAPFDVHLISLPGGEKTADKLYGELEKKGVSVFYDDRPQLGAGEKFNDADLIGIPLRIVASRKTVEQNKVEVKK